MLLIQAGERNLNKGWAQEGLKLEGRMPGESIAKERMLKVG